MNEELRKKVEERILNSPHVVILGAGASRTACPDGDKNGEILPLMDDFIEVLELDNLKELNLDSQYTNFEDIYNLLAQNKKYDHIRRDLEEKVYNFFNNLIIPDKPTIYDHLLLSLEKKDVVATFNWDPLIVQAYFRNRKFELPNILFLHGNVIAGYCEKDNVTGFKNTNCKYCGNILKPTKLLYPIHTKDYDLKGFITSQWKTLQSQINKSFFITIFGYSAPESDTRAIDLMKYAWGEIENRKMEQFEIIDIKTREKLRKTWSPFIHSHHYEVHNDFFDSWISKHPRRTLDAYYQQYWMAKSLDYNPIPRTLSFDVLWEFYRQIN